MDEPEQFPLHIREEGECDGEQFINQLLSGTRIGTLWRQLIRRDVMSEEALSVSPKIVFSEDFLINLRIGMNIRRVRGIADVVYHYNCFQGNTISTFKMTSEYLDEYYCELYRSVTTEQRNRLRKQLFSYRLGLATTHLGVRGLHRTQLVQSILSEREFQHGMPLRSRIGLMLLWIPSRMVRKGLWSLYGWMAEKAVNLINKNHNT